jgi:hypothetical protein
MKVNFRKLVNEEVQSVLKENPEIGKQLSLKFKPDPKQVMAKYVEEKEDELQDTLAEIEMLLRDNNLMTGVTMKSLNRIEESGNLFIKNIKVMQKVVDRISK